MYIATIQVANCFMLHKPQYKKMFLGVMVDQSGIEPETHPCEGYGMPFTYWPKKNTLLFTNYTRWEGLDLLE